MTAEDIARWTRRPTIIGGQVAPDDWIVLRDGVALGRVYRRPYIPGTPAFWWGSWTHPPQQGHVETMDAALEMCRRAIGDLPVPHKYGRPRG